GCWLRFYQVVVGRRGCKPFYLPHLSDEAKALARHCFYEALFLTGIAKGSPGNIQTRGNRSIGNDAAFPNCTDKLVLADDLSSLPDQVFDPSERLWRNRDKAPPAMQLAQISVQCIFLEEIAQFAKSSGRRFGSSVRSPSAV